MVTPTLALNLPFVESKSLTSQFVATDVTLSITNSNGSYYDATGLLIKPADNVARFDHDPVTLESLGLLVEPAGVNQCLHSEDITDAVWATTLAAPTGDTSVAPDGTTTADNLVYPGSQGSPQIRRLDQNVTASGGTASKTFTASVWVMGSGNFRVKNTHGGVADNFSGDFTATGNWVRYSFTVTNGAGAGTGDQIIGVLAASTDDAFDLQLWGWQLEENAVASSYIATAGSAVTRTADVVTTSDVSWYNNDEGVLYCEVSHIEPTATYSPVFQHIINISNGSNNNTFSIRFSSSVDNDRTEINANPGDDYQENGLTSTWVAGQVRRTATYLELNSARSAYQGTLGVEDTLVTPPVGIDQLNVGSSGSNGNVYFGHIREARYYNAKDFLADGDPDTGIQQLTLGNIIEAAAAADGGGGLAGYRGNWAQYRKPNQRMRQRRNQRPVRR